MRPLLPVAALAMTFACQSVEIQSVEVSGEVPTVLTVKWASPDDARGYVEWGEAGVFDHRTNLEAVADTRHETVVAGLPPDADIALRVVLENGRATDEEVVRTGAAPAEWPGLTVQSTGEHWEGYLVLSALGTVEGPLVIDSAGRIVWWRAEGGEPARVARARASQSEKGLVYGAPGHDEIVYVGWRGDVLRTVARAGLGSDFVEHEDGAIATLVVVEGDGPCPADGVVELDPDGGERVVWSAWDHLDPSPCGEGGTWTGAAALDHDEAAGTYQLSLARLDQVRAFAASGVEQWVFGGADGDWAFGHGSTPFVGQHQLLVEGDAITVFDNEGGEDGSSRAVRYALDPRGIATEEWTYAANPPLDVATLGDVARLPSGNLLVVWATAGRIDEVTPEGQRVWSASTSSGATFGYVTRVDHLGD